MTSRRELKNYAKQAMSGKYGILILAFVAVQALGSDQQHDILGFISGRGNN